MKSCTEIDPLFTPFIDDEIGREERLQVEAHLAGCPPCRNRAAIEQTARRVMRSRATALCGKASGRLLARCATTLAPQAGPRVWERLRAIWASPGAAGRLIPLSLAATMVLAIGVVFVSGLNDRLDAAFVAQLAIDHTRCFEQSAAVPGGLDARQAERRLRDEFGWQIAVPIQEEIELQDVRRCDYAHGQMAHLLYRHEGRPLSLFVVPDVRHGADELEIMGHEELVWSGHNRTYVLVGDESRAAMKTVAALMRRTAE